MTSGQFTLVGKVTAATATAITVTRGADSWDGQCAGTITTVVINGTGLTNWRVGDPVAFRITTA